MMIFVGYIHASYMHVTYQIAKSDLVLAHFLS